MALVTLSKQLSKELWITNFIKIIKKVCDCNHLTPTCYSKAIMFLDLKVFIFLDMNFSRNLSKNFIKCKKWFEKSRWSSFITIPILIKKKHIHSNFFMIVCWKSRDLVCCYSKIWKPLSPDETRRSFIQMDLQLKDYVHACVLAWWGAQLWLFIFPCPWYMKLLKLTRNRVAIYGSQTFWLSVGFLLHWAF